MQLVTSQVNFDENSEGLVIEHSQFIDPSYLDSLKTQRADSKSGREGEFMQVASIPVVIVEKWEREGFDFWNAPARQIVAKLKTEGLDYFLTTEKQV